MSAPERQQVETLSAQMEEMWGHLDALFERLSAGADDGPGWRRPHGPDWTLADVPYHLAYCNRGLIARAVELGADYPESEKELISSIEQLDDWNQRKFAERPPDQTPAESVAQWRQSVATIRRLLADMNDADLDGQSWMMLFAGWATARHLLMFGLTHDWSEFTQLRLHMGLSGPTPSPEITRAYLNAMLGYMPMRLDLGAAAGRDLTAVMAFTDPGVGAWTIRVAGGKATVEEGAAAEADLIMTQSSETYEKIMRGIQDPAAAVQAGDVQVNDVAALAVFETLFPA